MRRPISLALIASIAATSAACAVQSGEPAGDPAASSSTSQAMTSNPAAPNEAVVESLAAQPKLAQIGVKTEDPITIIAAAMTIYNAYKAITGLLTSSTDPSVQILQQLGDLKQQMQQVDAQLQQLDQQLANLAYQDRRGFYLQTLQSTQALEAQAQTASQQLTDYVQTGKNNAYLLASADNNSQIAANTLKEPAFYYRPASTAGAPDIFDLRQVLVSYMYALTVRMAVVALEHPDFRNNSGYRDEFQNHVNWLRQIPGLNWPNVDHWSAGGVSNNNYYNVCSRVTDTNSGFQSVIGGTYPSGYNPLCTDWLYGSQADATSTLQYYQWWDNWYVEDEMGIHTVNAMANAVAVDATAPISWIWPVPIGIIGGGPTYNSNGPLVSNDGRCLTLGYGAELESCSRGSATQTWQTAYQGGTASVSIQGGQTCLEVPDWRSGLMLMGKPCAGSPGESFTVTNANELRWQRDSSQCLTNDNGVAVLQACNGSKQQQWTRNWPIWIPIHIGGFLGQ